MRSAIHVKVITAQIEVLVDLKRKLESVLDNIETLINKGNAWIEEADDQKYTEINTFLSTETDECIKRCVNIEGSNDEDASNITLTNEEVKKLQLNTLSGAATSQISWSVPKGNQDYESLIAKFSQVESNISLLQILTNSIEENYLKMGKTIEELNDEKGTHDKKIKKIHQKLQSMEKHNESLANQNEEMGAKLDERIEEVMQELHTASEFMSGLQKQNEKLVNQMNASKKQVADLTNSFQNSQIQQTDLTNQIEERWQTKAIEDDNVSKKIKNITEKCTVMDERCSKLNGQMEILSDKIKESEKNDSVVSINNEKLTTLQQALKDQVQRLNTIDENMKMKEESDKLKLTEIQNRFEATNHSNVGVQSQFESLLSKTEKSKTKKLTDFQDNIQITNKSIVDLQDQLKSLSSKIDKANKDIEDTSSNVTSQNKDISDISAKLSALKSSTDQFIDSQKETTVDLNNEVASINIKMKSMFDDKADLLTRIKELETTDKIVAFNARADDGTFDLEKDEIMTCFNFATVNYNNVFDTKTGIFTVPVGGIYMCSLVIDVNTDQATYFKICLNSDQEIVIATSHTGIKNVMVCDTSIVRFNKNEQVYVKPHNTLPNIKFSHFSHFLCILIQKG